MQIYLLQKKKAPSPSKPGKRRQTDPTKIFASEQERRGKGEAKKFEQREQLRSLIAQSGK